MWFSLKHTKKNYRYWHCDHSKVNGTQMKIRGKYVALSLDLFFYLSSQKTILFIYFVTIYSGGSGWIMP